MTQNRRTKILIIDDDETITMQVERILEQNGYVPVSACNGREGLEKARTEQPDIILLDRRMPEMDGNMTLIELKDCEVTQNIPVVMLTGDTQVSDVSTSFELGALDYIVKPFDSDNFLIRIKKVLRDQAGT